VRFISASMERRREVGTRWLQNSEDRTNRANVTVVVACASDQISTAALKIAVARVNERQGSSRLRPVGRDRRCTALRYAGAKS
jgi:hypothetical protein